jgi:hypothetical protein
LDSYSVAAQPGLRGIDVRFGSKADMCGAKRHVRFTPNSDRESGHAANGHVCFTPESGHVQCDSPCLLWANSGQWCLSFEQLVRATRQR